MKLQRWAIPVIVAMSVLTVLVATIVLSSLMSSSGPAKQRRVPEKMAHATPTPTKVPSAAESMPPANRAIKPRSDSRGTFKLNAWEIVSFSGWLVSIVLATILIMLIKRWRTAFEDRQWLLLPSSAGADLTADMRQLSRITVQNIDKITNAVHLMREDARGMTGVVQETRTEFLILRDELDRKSREISHLRLGHEFHARRTVLVSIIRAVEIIKDDLMHHRDPSQTLEGVRVELTECLEDNSVSPFEPAIGSRIVDVRGADVASARHVATEDDALRGTIAGTDRAGYVARGPHGAEEILVPAKVRIYA